MFLLVGGIQDQRRPSPGRRRVLCPGWPGLGGWIPGWRFTLLVEFKFGESMGTQAGMQGC